jgi:hypothetical protein
VRQRRREIIPDGALMVEELARDDSADRVATHIVRSGATCAVSEEARDWIEPTWLQFRSLHVAFHPTSIVARGIRRVRPKQWSAARSTPSRTNSGRDTLQAGSIASSKWGVDLGGEKLGGLRVTDPPKSATSNQASITLS